MLLPVQTSRGRCTSDNISRENEGSLAYCWRLYSKFGPFGKTHSIFRTYEHIYTANSDLLVRHIQYFVPYEQFHYIFLWGRAYSGRKFIYLFGVLHHFKHCTDHITTCSLKGRGNQYIQFVRVLYCKLPTNGKQLPALPLEAVLGTEPQPQWWEARVLPLCHHGPLYSGRKGTHAVALAT